MTATDTPPPVDNPYVGPTSFRLGDLLYGRDREREDLLNLLIAERIVLLYSPSGAGKTSLIQAALTPALREAGFDVLPIIRVTHALEPEPGVAPAPNRYLLSVLLSLEEGLPPASQRPVAELATLSLREYLDARACRDDRPDNKVLIFDQFEEVLTTHPADEAAKRAFFRELGQMLRHRGHWALFSMREDFLAALDPYLRHVPTRFRTRFRLDLLSVDQALEAMRRPAQRMGVNFTQEAAHCLVDDLRRVRIQRPGGETEDMLGDWVEPVQLQVACRQLWSMLPRDVTGITPADVEALGDVDRALADYYANRIAQAAERTGVREAAIRDWVENGLITPQGLRSQVLEGPQGTGEAAYRLVVELIDAHLVRAEMRRQATWYELAHDRLIEPIRRDNAAWRARHLSAFERAAALWEQEGKPDRLLLVGAELTTAKEDDVVRAGGLTHRQREFLEASRRADEQLRRDRRTAAVLRRAARRLQIAVAVVTLLLVASSALAVFARRSSVRAEAASDLASARGLAARADRLADTRPDLAILLGLQSMDLAGGQDPIPIGLITGLAQLTHRTKSVLHGHDGALTDAAYGPGGARLATAGADGTVRLWDAMTGQQQGAPLVGHTGAVTAVAFSPDGARLATAGVDGTVRLWEAGTGRLQGAPLEGGNGPVTAVAFSPDGSRLAAAEEHGAVRLWDAGTGRQQGGPLVGHEGTVTAVAFSRDGTELASAGTDRTVRLWDTVTGRPRGGPLAGHDGAVTAVAFSPDGAWLASASADATARIWEVAETYTVRRRLAGDPGIARGVAFSPDGGLLATAGLNEGVRLWNVATGQRSGELAAPAGDMGSDAVTDVAFSLDGALLAAGGLDGRVWLWNAVTGQPQGEPLAGHTGSVNDLTFSPDGHLLATAGADETVRLWDTATGRPYRELRGSHTNAVNAVAFSPDSARLASADADGIVQLWDTTTGQAHPAPLTGHINRVTSVAFSPDGSLLASAGADGTVRLWITTTGRPDGEPLQGHTDAVNAVAFSPDGTLLVSAGTDQTVGLWDLRWWKRPPSDWTEAGCHLVNRNLSRAEWDQFAGGLPYQRTCPTLPAGE